MKRVKVGAIRTQEPWKCRKVSCRYFFQDGTSMYNQYGVGFPESCSTQGMVDHIVRHCKELVDEPLCSVVKVKIISVNGNKVNQIVD